MKSMVLVAVVVFVLMAGTAHALNLWISNTMYSGKTFTVEAGYRGYLMNPPPNTFVERVIWGTFDSETYTLETSVTGNASRFFKRFRKRITIGPAVEGDKYANSYKYEVYLRIPRRTMPGNYTFNICGKVTSNDLPISLRLCTGDKMLSVKRYVK